MGVVKTALTGLLGAAILLAACAGAYFVGRSSVDTPDVARIRADATMKAYNRGSTDGYRQGKRDGAVGYEEGGDGYEAIYAAGRKKGYRSGKRAGLAAGTASGAVVGQDYVFDGFSGWDVGRWYAVRIGQGEDGARFTIKTRVDMEAWSRVPPLPGRRHRGLRQRAQLAACG